jgi:hypothetical protein
MNGVFGYFLWRRLLSLLLFFARVYVYWLRLFASLVLMVCILCVLAMVT